MKNFSPALLALLQGNTELIRADLFKFQLRNGQVLAATSGQLDITYSGVTYKASSQLTNGAWKRGTVRLSLGTESNNCTMTCNAGPLVYFPGTTTPILTALLKGLFDNAILTIYTAYMPVYEYGNVSAGVETKFVGICGKITKQGRTTVQLEVNDLLYILNVQLPRNLIQSSCRHTLYDPNCTLSRSTFAQGNAINAVSGTYVNLQSAISQPPPYFSQGTIDVTSGQNAGLAATIVQQNGPTQLLITVPFPFPFANGDSVSIAPGCDKTVATCTSRFNNLINFGGEPFVPAPETVL